MVCRSHLSTSFCSHRRTGYGRTGTAGGGGSGYNVLASVGTSTSPTAKGTKAVTGVGFTPKLVMPFGVGNMAVGSIGPLAMGIGATASTSSRFAVSVSARESVTTSDTDRRHTASKAFERIDQVAVDLSADLSSLDADGFTLDWSSVFASARILNHIAIGGDIEVSITQHQMNGTNAAQSFAHGLTGGAPDALLFVSAVNPIVPASTVGVLYFTIGAWAGGTQFAAGVFSENAVTTTATRRALLNNASLAHISDGGIRRSLAVASVDGANVNAIYPATGATTQSHFWIIAIRNCKAQVGTFDCNGSRDPLTISCPGITPKLFLPVFVNNGVDNINSLIIASFLTIGASDGVNNVSCGITESNGLTTTNARRFQSSTSFSEYDSSGGRQFQATATFGGESVILDPTDNPAPSWGQGAFLILGN